MLCGEISAKYHLLLINKRFCHFKQKAVVLILVVMTMEFEENEILLKNSINLQNFKQI